MSDDVASTFTGGVKPYRVVGWTSDGEIYCTACAADRGFVNEKPTDQLERDDGSPVFADSEWDTRPTCGDCSASIPYATVLAGGESE